MGKRELAGRLNRVERALHLNPQRAKWVISNIAHMERRKKQGQGKLERGKQVEGHTNKGFEEGSIVQEAMMRKKKRVPNGAEEEGRRPWPELSKKSIS